MFFWRTVSSFRVIGPMTYNSVVFSEKNSLSFIETSALDSTNVEQAFQNILTGKAFTLLGYYFTINKFDIPIVEYCFLKKIS